MVRLSVFLCSLLFLVSCAAGSQSESVKSFQVRSDQAVLTIYMGASGAAEVDANARLEDVAIEVDGAWIELGLAPVELGYLNLKERQMLVGSAVAPLGEHRRLRLRFSSLPVGGTDASEQLMTLSLPEPLELRSGSSKCLFVDWQLISAQPRSKQLTSSFSAWGQGQALGGELLYVACQAINTVYVVRMDINEVVSAFGVPGPLAEIRMQSDERRLYILSRGRRAIYVYDCLNSRLIDQISLSGSIAPENMVLSADGDYAFVSDAAAGAVFKVELSSGQLVAQNRIGHRPQRMTYIDAGQGRLAVAVPSSNQVLILNAEDLRIQRSIPVGIRPAGLLYFADALYVAESGSQSVAVFAFQSGKQLAKITVGLQPDSLIGIDQSNAYVSNSGEQSLTALSAGQNMAFRRIDTVKNPTEMVYSLRKRLLYVASPRLNALGVLDRDSEKVLQQIVFGGVPGSMAILE